MVIDPRQKAQQMVDIIRPWISAAVREVEKRVNDIDSGANNRCYQLELRLHAAEVQNQNLLIRLERLESGNKTA